MPASVGLAAHYLPVDRHLVVGAAALAPYLMLGAPLALIAFTVGRQGLAALIAGVLTAAAVGTELPLFVGAAPPAGSSISIRVMTANMFLGQADPQKLVASAESTADVLAVQELTPAAVRGLSAAGLDRIFPYRVLDARDYASGVGMWSRFPITVSERIDGFELAMVSARIRVDEVSVDPTVVVAHLSGPWPQPMDDWQRDMDRLPAALRTATESAAGGCVVLAGDFNATYDMRTFRGLLENGFRDSAEQSGAGVTATFPANTWLPPLIAIDHVLTQGCAATETQVLGLPGSDHRGLSSTVAVPHAPNDI